MKSEVTAASDDTYDDVAMATVDDRKHEVGAFLRELTTKYKDEMEALRTGTSKENGKFILKHKTNRISNTYFYSICVISLGL